MDPSNQATLADAEAATDWHPLPDWESWGYGDETIWIRVELRASEINERMPWVVRVRPSYLDYVTLYDPATGKVLRTGDALPPIDDISSIVFSPQISPLTYERTIYLEIRSTSARTLKVDVLPYEQAQRKNHLQEWFLGLLLASSLVFTLWAFIQWWGTRELVIGAFALKQLFLTCWLFFTLGFARIVLGPVLGEGVLTMIASCILPWTMSATIWFYYTLIKGYQPHRFVLYGFKAMGAFTMLLPLFYWFAPTYLVLSIANISLLFSHAFFLIALLSAIPNKVKQPIPSSIFLGYLLIYCTFNSFAPLMYWGWFEANELALLAGAAHAIFDAAIMSFMLQIRARNMQKEQEKIALDFQKSLETVAIQKHHREEQSQLFAMLAHEIKTPLSTLRMWMEAGQLTPGTMERAIADMNSVIERCVHTSQLADHGLQATIQQVSPSELTRNCIQSCRAPERVDFEAPGTNFLMHTDAQMLSIVLGNVLDNACKYSLPRSRIQVILVPSVQDGSAGWSWQVRNRAGQAGLPNPDRLFKKYYRSSGAQSQSGSGLGLFLVKSLLALLDGSIHYESQQDHAIFSFWVSSSLATR